MSGRTRARLRSAASDRSDRRGRARVRLARAGLVAVFVGTLGCVPARGGWEGDALARARPGLAAIEGQRLADMVPVPALALDEVGSEREDGDPVGQGGSAPIRVQLVACRFEPGAAIRLRAGGAGWDEAVGGAVIEAFAREIERFGLALTRVEAGPAEIEIDAFVGEGGSAPVGLGDTLVECDVDGRGHDAGTAGAGEPGVEPPAIRGTVRHAEIRMRRSAIDPAGRLQMADDDAWSGALLHELGHALGFAGHAATGRSTLVRDEHVLRRIGRRVLAGGGVSDPTLEALHHLRPGEPLGERPLGGSADLVLRLLETLDRERVAAGNPRIAVVASVGDREARWSIRYADGSRLGLRFPGWAMRLRSGGVILVWPDRETLAAIAAAIQRRVP